MHLLGCVVLVVGWFVGGLRRFRLLYGCFVVCYMVALGVCGCSCFVFVLDLLFMGAY